MYHTHLIQVGSHLPKFTKNTINFLSGFLFNFKMFDCKWGVYKAVSAEQVWLTLFCCHVNLENFGLQIWYSGWKMCIQPENIEYAGWVNSSILVSKFILRILQMRNTFIYGLFCLRYYRKIFCHAQQKSLSA